MNGRGTPLPPGVTAGEGSPSASAGAADEDDLAQMMATDMSRLLADTRDENEAADAAPQPLAWAGAAAAASAAPPAQRGAKRGGGAGGAVGTPAAAPLLQPSPPRTRAAAAQAGGPPDSATAAFVAEALSLVDADDVAALGELQQRTLSNLQDSTEMLANFNRFSAASYAQAAAACARSTRLVQSVTADLHHIFKRTRALQARIREAHPAAWAAVGERPRFGDDD